MNKKILFIIAVLASAALSARAQNLVTNPGFETGDFSGWTQFGDTSFTDVQSFNVHSGSFAAEFGPTASDGGITQNIATTPGITYTVDFWLDNRDTSGTNHMSASFAGVTVLTLTSAPAFTYTEYTFSVLATTSSSLLQFSFYNPPSWWDLDDVSVTAVPEPGTLGLIVLGALGLVGTLRKRLV
jgi:PEP-CTERM motif-containing protein